MSYGRHQNQTNQNGRGVVESKVEDYLGKTRDESVDVGSLGGHQDFHHAQLPRVVSVGNVLGHGPIEEPRGLLDEGHVGADGGGVEGPQVTPVNDLENE